VLVPKYETSEEHSQPLNTCQADGTIDGDPDNSFYGRICFTGLEGL
jgi:hypothetical protein